MRQSHTLPAFRVQRIGRDERSLRWLGLVAAGLILLGLGYWVGRQNVTPGLTAALTRAGIEDRRGELERQVEQLTARLVIAERSAQVAELATEQVRQEVIARQDELRELRSEVAFYRGVLAERGGAAGARLYGFAMEPQSGRLELVLVQGRPNGQLAEGHLEVRLVDPEAVDAEALYARVAPVARTAYAFEYFQQLTLPLGFLDPAGAVLVTLLPSGKGAKPRHYLRRWPDASGEGGVAARQD